MPKPPYLSPDRQEIEILYGAPLHLPYRPAAAITRTHKPAHSSPTGYAATGLRPARRQPREPPAPRAASACACATGEFIRDPGQPERLAMQIGPQPERLCTPRTDGMSSRVSA